MTGADRPFRVRMLYHPTIHVPSLDEAEDFYARVFGRPSTNFSVVMPDPPAPGHSVGYSTFTAISDVLIDNLEPKLYLTGGVQRYPDVDSPHRIAHRSEGALVTDPATSLGIPWGFTTDSVPGDLR